MPGRFDPDEILARNPQIDQARLEEARDMLRRLREKGVRRKGYDLAPPFGGRRAVVKDKSRAEPRQVRARRPGTAK